jgi:uncharacterized protein with PIN domain
MFRFLVDIMLGKLAKWLRLLGYDVEYKEVKELCVLETFLNKGYVFLTRRQAWLNYKRLRNKPVYFITANEPFAQLCEVVKKLDLKFDPSTFCSRCLICNTLLEEKTREEVVNLVPDYVLHTYQTFKQCPQCKRVYWPGSHKEKMLARLKICFTEKNKQESPAF